MCLRVPRTRKHIKLDKFLRMAVKYLNASVTPRRSLMSRLKCEQEGKVVYVRAG